MENKVLLVLVDGMRPDSLRRCGHPFVDEFLAQSACALDALTVMPSVTLPCHMSLFHSVDPGRHGVLTNVYTPQVRPIPGLCEQLRLHGKTSGFFYNWEELRDLSLAGFIGGQRVRVRSCAYIRSRQPPGYGRRNCRHPGRRTRFCVPIPWPNRRGWP